MTGPTSLPVEAFRRQAMIAPPIALDQAYRDPRRVIATVRNFAPYQLTATLQNLGPAVRRMVGPNFRRIWSHEEAVPGNEGDYLLDNPLFIEASRTLFGAQIVRPRSVMINLTLPFETNAPPHLDLPTFVGCDQNDVPDWMRGVMGNSLLFRDWAVPVAAALAWYYRGVGGEFEYWPLGPAEQPLVIAPPLWNQAVVSDNDYMYHRVASQGRPQDYFRAELGAGAVLDYEAATGDWHLVDEGRPMARYDEADVRVSILWKALAFRDEAEAERFDKADASLDVDRITAIFAADLRAREIEFTLPADPATDPDWRALLTSSYPPQILIEGWRKASAASHA